MMARETSHKGIRTDGRLPPNNQQAEQSVLGCALSGERPLAEITAMLKSDDFYRPDHRLIYSAVCELYMDSKPVDIITVSDMLASRSQLDQAGGLSYISSLPDQCVRMECHSSLGRILLRQELAAAGVLSEHV